jgi:hypothetical protein
MLMPTLGGLNDKNIILWGSKYYIILSKFLF